LNAVNKYPFWLVLIFNVITLFICFGIGWNWQVLFIVFAVFANTTLLILFYRQWQNNPVIDLNHTNTNNLINSKINQDTISNKKQNAVEYSNNLLKLMYRQEDILKAINFIGNEFNISQYNYFFASSNFLSSVITNDSVAINGSDNLLSVVYNSGIDKFIELDMDKLKVSSALGEKEISSLYYIILKKDEDSIGIAELGFSRKLDPETLENLKMCTNELTKF
jgi:hypothetical protein